MFSIEEGQSLIFCEFQIKKMTVSKNRAIFDTHLCLAHVPDIRALITWLHSPWLIFSAYCLPYFADCSNFWKVFTFLITFLVNLTPDASESYPKKKGIGFELSVLSNSNDYTQNNFILRQKVDGKLSTFNSNGVRSRIAISMAISSHTILIARAPAMTSHSRDEIASREDGIIDRWESVSIGESGMIPLMWCHRIPFPSLSLSNQYLHIIKDLHILLFLLPLVQHFYRIFWRVVNGNNYIPSRTRHTGVFWLCFLAISYRLQSVERV